MKQGRCTWKHDKEIIRFTRGRGPVNGNDEGDVSTRRGYTGAPSKEVEEVQKRVYVRVVYSERVRGISFIVCGVRVLNG